MQFDFGTILTKTGLTLKKYLPEILTGVGVGGTIAATVMVTMKSASIEAIKQAYRDDMRQLDIANEEAEENKKETGLREFYDPDSGEMVPYSLSEHKKCKRIVTFNAVKDGAKELWLPVAMEVVSIGLIAAGSGISRHRANESAAMFSALAGAYAAYRKRVQNALGDEAERRIRYGIEQHEIVEEVVDEKGKKKTKKTVVDEIADPVVNPFAVVYTVGCKGYEKNAEYNKAFLLNVQAALTKKLKERGFLFVNDVYDALGITLTEKGHDWGWLYDKNNLVGVDHIDLGIMHACNVRACNYDECSFIIDITPMANIRDKLWMTKDYHSLGSSNLLMDMIDYPQMYQQAKEDGTI